jgi:hypothetical protein
MRTVDPSVPEITVLSYNTVTKEIVNSNTATVDLFNSNLQFVSQRGNVTSNTLEFINPTTSFVTTGNVGIHNTHSIHTLDVGSNLFVDDIGSNILVVTGNTFTSRKALIGSNLIMDTLGSNVVEVTGNVNVSNYTKTDYITVYKDAQIKGNLLVEGTTTTTDTENVTFENAVISLANNNIQSTTDIGIIMKQPDSNASPSIIFRGDEKEIMIGYTLNSSSDSDITPDSANVIDLHVYGNVIAQNNITLTSGELTAITLNGNVIGNNVDAITLTGNVVGDNANVITLYGNVIGNNVDVVTLTGNVIGNNVDVITLTGNVIGNNVDVVTLTGNVIGNNVDVITLTGNVIGNNVDVVTLTGNVIGNNVDVITLYGNVIADNVYVTNNIETTSGFFKGDGGILSNVTLQQVTDAGNTTSNTVLFTNAHTAFTTDLTSNVGVKLNQLSNVIITDPNDHKSLLYIDGNWIDDYIDFTSIEVKAGEALSKGDVVYIHDGSGDTPEVRKANSSSASTMPAIGIVMDGNIDQNENGHVVTFGTFGMTFDANFQKGEILYVSNTTPGGLMNTVPFNNTDKIQNVGIVVKSGDKILVTGVGRSNDIPNAEEVYAQPAYVYVNSSGNELKKILASNLSANNQTLDMVTSWSNSTTNTIASTHTTTGFISSGNVHVGSNIQVSGLRSGFVPIVGSDKFLHDSVIEYSGDTTTISSNVEITGNLSVIGNTFTIESNSLVINDRVLGIANNNVSHSLDVGIIMGHPEHNVAFIHHGEPDGQDSYEHELVLGYTNNVVTDNHVLYTDANLITFRVLGNVIVQNNLTLTSGNLTAITVNSNVVGDSVSAITLNGNVVADNVVATNGMYGTIKGANTISASTINAVTINSNVVADNVVATNGMYGIIAGSNTISASTINAVTINSNVVADNVVATNIYGTIAGANTISASTISATDTVTSISTSGNVLVTGNVTANKFYGDGSAIISLDPSRLSSQVLITEGGTGLTSVAQNELLLGPASGTAFSTLPPYAPGDSTKKFLRSSATGIAWDDVSSTLQTITDGGNTTSNIVQFTNATTGIEITSNIDFVNKITLKSTSGTKSNLFVVNAIQLDPDYAEPSLNVLSYNTTTGEIYDSGGLGGSLFDNITEENANVLIGSNLTINSLGSNVLTVSGNVDASNITISGNVTSQNIKLTNTDITASITTNTITVDAKEKTYGTAPPVFSTSDVSNLVFSNLISGAQIVIPIVPSGNTISISSTMSNVDFYAITSDVVVTQNNHALMTLSNLYGNIYMNAIKFS